MKIDEADPRRIEEEGDETMRAFVRVRKTGPTKVALERLSQRLVAARVLTPPEASTVSGARRAESKFVHYKWDVLAIVVVGGLLQAWRTVQSSEVPAGETALAGPPAPASPSTSTGAVARHGSEPVVEQEGTAPAAIAVDQLPSAVPAHRSDSATTGPRAVLGKVPATELDLVQEAQSALTAEPKRALALTTEHAQRYPSGEFVQEREVIAVEALSKMGRRDEASRRARALIERFPSTPYAARLKKAVGHSVLPASTRPNGAVSPP